MFGIGASDYTDKRCDFLSEAVCGLEKKLEHKIACLSELLRRLEERVKRLEGEE